eukprot:scaffold77043_cov26-Prasinocladus_malaysianus.AAC.1
MPFCIDNKSLHVSKASLPCRCVETDVHESQDWRNDDCKLAHVPVLKADIDLCNITTTAMESDNHVANLWFTGATQISDRYWLLLPSLWNSEFVWWNLAPANAVAARFALRPSVYLQAQAELVDDSSDQSEAWI